MKRSFPMRAAQRGFSLLTGFFLAIIMFGALAYFLAGQGINAGLGATYSNTSKVSGLLSSAGYIATGFDSVTLAGTAASAVTFNTTAVTGIFNPSSGGATPQPLDPSLFSTSASTDGYWIYRGNDITLNTVGVAGTADYTIATSGLKLSVCQQINNTLHGTALTTTPTVLTAFTTALLLGAPTAASPTVTGTAADISALGTAGWLNGCYATADGTANYVYIHTLLAQ